MNTVSLEGFCAMIATRDGKQIDSASLFSALMDNFPDMIHSVDEQGNIIFFNQMALSLLGYTQDQFTGMNIRQLYAPEVLEAVEKGFLELKQTGEKRVESLFIAKDGTRIPVEQRTLAICDEQGSFMQTFTVSRDIRKLKEMQDGMLHAGRLAAIGELAAGVVHDINNPLTAVSLANTLLQQLIDERVQMADELRSQTTELFAMIKESAETIEHIASRLRDFSRGVKDQHVPVDLFDPINDALFILGHRVKTGRVTVLCPVVKAKYWTFGDHNQIEQVFLNLFANACDAMAKSEVRELTVGITPEVKEGRAFLCCTVQDTGEGIKEEDVERVFNAFHTTKPRGQGTGLGLSIARSILTEHGGEITVQSERGKGTTFTLWLPSFAYRAQSA